jgi:hypothetical protein
MQTSTKTLHKAGTEKSKVKTQCPRVELGEINRGTGLCRLRESQK